MYKDVNTTLKFTAEKKVRGMTKTKMDRSKLEELYRENGLLNYYLESTEDLLKIHGIDYTKIKGYEALDTYSKEIFKEFIIYYWNREGLDSRIAMRPVKVFIDRKSGDLRFVWSDGYYRFPVIVVGPDYCIEPW